MTRPREAVWEVLRHADEHLTAEQIAERAERLSPGVNLASVYRALALLADLDLVRESQLRDGEGARWEVAHPDEHFHLVCERCGEVTHHGGRLVDDIRRHLSTSHGFRAAAVELVVTGRCSDCADV
jgi:Fur family transcriptional regulator, ferric uptake regulator